MVDANDVGSVTVLLQEGDDGTDHPVCYFSCKFIPTRRIIQCVKKLTLLLALQHFCVYLEVQCSLLRSSCGGSVCVQPPCIY